MFPYTNASAYVEPMEAHNAARPNVSGHSALVALGQLDHSTRTPRDSFGAPYSAPSGAPTWIEVPD